MRIGRGAGNESWTDGRQRGTIAVALLPTSTPWTLAQTVMSDRPAEVIAQGDGEIPDGEAIWRDAEVAERETGFVVVPQGRATVADMAPGQRAMLTDAEAAFQAAGAEHLWQSAGEGPVPCLTGDLVPVDAIGDRLAEDVLLMNAGQFTAPGGEV